MSDPIAVSILGKVTSWYSFEGNLNDSAGPNNITAGTVVVSGYEPGIRGTQLKLGSRGAALLANPFSLTRTMSCCIGGWIDYNFMGTVASLVSIGYDFLGRNEALTLNPDNAGDLLFESWANNSSETIISYPALTRIKYPVTVAADDSNGVTATSEQVINVNTTSPQAGRFFMVGNLINGVMTMYVDGVLRGSAPLAAGTLRSDPVKYFQVGNQFANSNTPSGLDEMFFCQSAALTSDEIAWLYNNDVGRSYTDVVNAAS